MTITVTDFERITGISRHTVYSWFYRDKFPEGVQAAKSFVTSKGATKLLVVNKQSEYYQMLKKQLA